MLSPVNRYWFIEMEVKPEMLNCGMAGTSAMRPVSPVKEPKLGMG
jgi:hypothetical protein